MPKGIPKNGINKGWFKKDKYAGYGFTKDHVPWNKGKKGRQKNHNTTGLTPGWNKWKKMPTITNEKHYCWKGDQVSYRSLHRWVERKLGKPLHCEKCKKSKTTPKSIQWANKQHDYKRNLNDWIALCASCHKQYDQTNNIKKNILQIRKDRRSNISI